MVENLNILIVRADPPSPVQNRVNMMHPASESKPKMEINSNGDSEESKVIDDDRAKHLVKINDYKSYAKVVVSDKS